MDTLLTEYIGDMVSMDDVLEDRLSDEAASLLDWHRNTQLEEYQKWFADIQNDIRPDVSTEDVIQHFNQLEAHWKVLLNKATDDGAELIPLLSKQQQNELLKNIDNKNTAFAEKYINISDDERLEMYAERIEDSLEPWFDDFNDKQLTIISHSSKQLVPLAVERLHERQQWAKGLGEQIKRFQSNAKGINKAQFTADLKQYFSGAGTKLHPQAEKKRELNKKVIAEMLVKLIRGMDTEQKQHLLSKLKEYQQMLGELAKDQ